MYNSLSQTLLKITSPGVPDFYQGTEIWDFSLVDPDNRRPVNFDVRKNMLKTLKEKMALGGSDLPGFVRGLLQDWKDGSIKLYVTFKSLNYRKESGQLFMEGAYLPLQSDGDLQNHICALARKCEQKVVLVITPRFLTRLIQNPEEMPLGKIFSNEIICICCIGETSEGYRRSRGFVPVFFLRRVKRGPQIAKSRSLRLCPVNPRILF